MLKKIYLASKSPRRKKILEQVGINFEVIEINIDESCKKNEMPEDYVKRISIEKARQGKLQAKSNFSILAADTAVAVDNVVLGKANCSDDAHSMLEKLSGRTHYVLTAVTVIDKIERTRVNISRVVFKKLTESEINSYCKTMEPIGKAGGYAIQGKGARFIDKLEGSYSNVMGLPLNETIELLEG